MNRHPRNRNLAFLRSTPARRVLERTRGGFSRFLVAGIFGFSAIFTAGGDFNAAFVRAAEPLVNAESFVDDGAAFDFNNNNAFAGDNSDFSLPSGDGTQRDLAEQTVGIDPNARALAERYETKRVGGSTIYAPTAPISNAPIAVASQFGWKGADDEFGEVYVLYGDCRVSQNNDVVSAPAAVVWRSRPIETGPAKLVVYLERVGGTPEPIRVELNSNWAEAKNNGDSWIGSFQTTGEIDLRVATPGENQLNPEEIYYRASEAARRAAPKSTVASAAVANAQAASLLGAGSGAGSVSNVQIAPGQALPPAPNPNAVATLPNVETAPTSELGTGDVSVEAPNARAAAPPEPGTLGWADAGSGDAIVEIPETSQTEDYLNSLAAPKTAPYRRVRLSQRYDREMEIKSRPKSGQSSEGDGKDVWLVSNGFTIVVQGVDANGNDVGEPLELSADQATIWTVGLDALDSNKITPADLDFELYLSGDVVFRSGDNVAYAKKMYYDVKNFVGIVEDAELVAEIPGVKDGYFRIGAERIVQRGPNALYATDAWLSTSQMGDPSYRLRSNSLVAEQSSDPLYDAATGRPLIDPETGRQSVQTRQYFIAENNFVTVGCVPIFYWPWMAMDVKDRSLYLRNVKFGSDDVFGTQVRTTWNAYQLLNMRAPEGEGNEWDLNLDYLSKRGFGHGTTFSYNRDRLWNWDTRVVGLASYYGISDKGTDNLGYGRRSVDFPHSYRYRALWKHRQDLGALGCLGDGWLLTAQVGKSSDRNFVPEYFEEEWNTSSNPLTAFELKKTTNNRSLALTASFRTDSFYTQTSRLPQLEHNWLGQSLFGSNLVWYERTKLGYDRFRTTDEPYATEDKELFRYLDWELASDSTSNSPFSTGTKTLSANSVNFSTRHELDAPFQLGAVKTTPYALGEYAFWGQGVEQTNVSRLYGRLGVRFNLPIWKVDSNVESKTWYLNGLAHKANIVVDASYSDANKNFDDLVLYDQIDDWQVEDFRRRYSVTTFSGNGIDGFSDSIPVRFDERYYAIRQGEIGGNVTSASTELADDLQLVRVGWNNRWQTKRGPASRRRTVDWITLNAGINLYPKKEQNFGKVPGLIDYDANWLVGDRFSVLSSGLYDVWGSGQKITRLGVQTKRPGLSSVYLGVDRLHGPIDSTYLNLEATYRASEKWGFSFGNSFDLSEGYNIGQKLAVSRVGESFVVTVGANRNESKDNWGINFTIEPVFLFDKDKKEEGMLGLGSM